MTIRTQIIKLVARKSAVRKKYKEKICKILKHQIFKKEGATTSWTFG